MAGADTGHQIDWWFGICVHLRHLRLNALADPLVAWRQQKPVEAGWRLIEQQKQTVKGNMNE